LPIENPQEYAVFQNKGYQGLYGGLGVKEIHTKKGLEKSQKILDHMGSTELAANLFRATQQKEDYIYIQSPATGDYQSLQKQFERWWQKQSKEFLITRL
jgi:phosphatidylserine/phosphatidylglycerophosphate/cardiolipin synthase-like enzyme